jgi:aryl-alcohol dehydrogenase-like predicted oxidoreductase
MILVKKILKLALGTAQFGLNYGVANTAGRIDFEMANKVLTKAQNFGLDTLDTAVSYGDSESILGSIGVEHWKIISKLPEYPIGVLDLANWAEKHVLDSLRRMGVHKLYGLLLHRPGQLLGDRGPELYNALVNLRATGLVSKIGISIYSSNELGPLLDKFTFDIVQAPLNILDRNLVESGWAHNLKAAGVEVHARSVFLQGLLLMPADMRPSKFDRWANIWQEWDRWLKSSQLTPLEACLRYASASDFVDRMVVGVDSVSQLEEILRFSDDPLSSLPVFKQMQDVRLINPASWSQL